MIYEGKAITVKALESGIVELKFDLKGESVNKFNRLTLNELRQAVDTIKADASIKGVIVSSGKDVFIVGADITEFVENFKLPDAELVAGNLEANKIFSDFEDLNVPTVAAINGIALGGGLEMCLAQFPRMSDRQDAGRISGHLPGFGGTVRLPRYRADTPSNGRRRRKTKPKTLESRCCRRVLLRRNWPSCAEKSQGRQTRVDYKESVIRSWKTQVNAIEQNDVVEPPKVSWGPAGPNYPAPVEAIKPSEGANFVGQGPGSGSWPASSNCRKPRCPDLSCCS